MGPYIITHAKLLHDRFGGPTRQLGLWHRAWIIVGSAAEQYEASLRIVGANNPRRFDIFCDALVEQQSGDEQEAKLPTMLDRRGREPDKVDPRPGDQTRLRGAGDPASDEQVAIGRILEEDRLRPAQREPVKEQQ